MGTTGRMTSESTANCSRLATSFAVRRTENPSICALKRRSTVTTMARATARSAKAYHVAAPSPW
ncbi:MAG: hypothetical protein IPJ28_15530 [Betaproteobacteria bacterium]|nr:hypothetical protein [Betaproteobacteria bacterium]